MSAIYQISAITDQFSMGGQDCLQLVDSTFYLFGVAWPLGDFTTPTIQVLKSTDDGVNWSHVAYGPTIRNFINGSRNTTHNWIACIPNGTTINIFYCSSTGASSQTSLTGLLSEVDFNTLTDAFTGGAVSDFNPFGYSFNNIATYTESTQNEFLPMIVRRTSAGVYRIVMANEFNTVTQVSVYATTTYSGGVFSASKAPVTLGSSYPGSVIGGIIDQTTDTFTVLFNDLSSVPFQGVLNLDGTITRLQDFSSGDVSFAKFLYLDSNKVYINWAYRPSSSDFASILSGASNSDPITLTKEDVDSTLPVGNTYTQNPQTAIFNNGDTCYCSFYFAKKVGATQMHLLKSFKVGAFWQAYNIEALFSDATVDVDTNALFFNYSAVFHGGNKFSMVAGGNFLERLIALPPAYPVYFARGDISFHSSCITVVNLSIQVSDTLAFADHIDVPVPSTPGTGTVVHNCPDVIISSAYCASIKTAVDEEPLLHDCADQVFAETAQPCLEME